MVFMFPDEILEGTCALINCKEYWKPLEYEVILKCYGNCYSYDNEEC